MWAQQQRRVMFYLNKHTYNTGFITLNIVKHHIAMHDGGFPLLIDSEFMRIFLHATTFLTKTIFFMLKP